jgi:uncharacterized membrane protein YqaE (UPF0057 family)
MFDDEFYFGLLQILPMISPPIGVAVKPALLSSFAFINIILIVLFRIQYCYNNNIFSSDY